MSKRKRELNPRVEKGDKIMCLHMDGETSVPIGTKGIVTRVGKDPFEDDGELIEVKWENGSTLALVSVTDSWIKADEV
jgi:co-chaperonin GroES (HSP10)